MVLRHHFVLNLNNMEKNSAKVSFTEIEQAFFAENVESID